MSPRNPQSKQRSNHLWVLESGMPEDVDLRDHVSAIVRILGPHVPEFQRLRANVVIDLHLGWRPLQPSQALELGQGDIRLLADIGAGVVVDIYTQ